MGLPARILDCAWCKCGAALIQVGDKLCVGCLMCKAQGPQVKGEYDAIAAWNQIGHMKARKEDLETILTRQRGLLDSIEDALDAYRNEATK